MELEGSAITELSDFRFCLVDHKSWSLPAEMIAVRLGKSRKKTRIEPIIMPANGGHPLRTVSWFHEGEVRDGRLSVVQNSNSQGLKLVGGFTSINLCPSQRLITSSRIRKHDWVKITTAVDGAMQTVSELTSLLNSSFLTRSNEGGCLLEFFLTIPVVKVWLSEVCMAKEIVMILGEKTAFQQSNLKTPTVKIPRYYCK